MNAQLTEHFAHILLRMAYGPRRECKANLQTYT